MDLSNYSVKDFVMNESFQKWTLEPDLEGKAFWENWLNERPEKIELIAEARSIIESLKASYERTLDGELDEVWLRITESIYDSDKDAITKNNLNNELLKFTNL
jgi:transmembrane sensor